jgi:hypothetical protein
MSITRIHIKKKLKIRSAVKDSHAVGITVQRRLSALNLTSFDVFEYLQDRHFGIMPRLRRILLPCQIPPCHIEFLKVSTILLLWQKFTSFSKFVD